MQVRLCYFSVQSVQKLLPDPLPPGESQNPYSNLQGPACSVPPFPCLTTSSTALPLHSAKTTLPSSSFSGWWNPLSSLRCHHSVRPASHHSLFPSLLYFSLSTQDLLTCQVVDYCFCWLSVPSLKHKLYEDRNLFVHCGISWTCNSAWQVVDAS